MFLCGLAGIALYNITLNTGQQTVAAGAASFIVNSAPILTALLALVFLKERFTVWGWIGTVISFGGIALIASGPARRAYIRRRNHLRPRRGDLHRRLFRAAETACRQIRRDALRRLYDADRGAVAFPLDARSRNDARFGLRHHHRCRRRARGLSRRARDTRPGRTRWAISAQPRASNFLYLIAPVATALAFLLTGEAPNAQTLVGGALSIAGVVIVNTRGRN
jgi:uncharacterized membrane protein